MGTAVKHPVPDQDKQSLVIFDIWAVGTLTLTAQYVFYSCTHMAIVDVKGLTMSNAESTFISDICNSHFFRSIAYTDHCLHYLLPEKLNRSMNLRHKGHEYTLSHIRTTQFKNTFVNRCLFSMV